VGAGDVERERAEFAGGRRKMPSITRQKLQIWAPRRIGESKGADQLISHMNGCVCENSSACIKELPNFCEQQFALKDEVVAITEGVGLDVFMLCYAFDVFCSRRCLFVKILFVEL
jgi:hypothetical protein